MRVKMKVILPSAGYATRMYPLTQNFPKALLDLHGRPIIEYAISKVKHSGCADKITVVSNNRDYQRFLQWRKGLHSDLEISVINDGTNSDKERLGSVKDVSLALGKDEEFIVINPDNLFTFDLAEMYKSFREMKKSVIALYDVKTVEQARKMGNPLLDENSRIIGFKEKDPNVESTICTVGIYFFTREVAGRLRQYLKEGNSSDRFGDFISWLFSREEVYGHLYDSRNRWFDIGSVESYEKTKEIKDVKDFL